MGLLSFLFGKKGKIEQVPTMNAQQQQLLSQLLSNLGGASTEGLGFLQNLLSGDTEAFEAPLQRQFQEEIVPGLAERFSGIGSGAQGSSAFGQALGSAGAGLAEQLGAMRGNLQMQGLGQLGNFMNLGMGARPFENVYQPGSSGFLGGLSGGIGSMLGGGIGSGLGKLLGY